MAWRVAKSLEVLLKQVNKKWPGRSKASDGSVGDTKHSARKSDHNPTAAGIVCARDFTHDPKHGLDARELAEALLASKDPRIKYVISNGEIASGTGANHPAWKWRPYSGVNAHRKHVHISVKADKALYDSTVAWKLDVKTKATKKPASGRQLVEAPFPILQPELVVAPVPVAVALDKETIQNVQRRLADLGYNPGGIDGLPGPLTNGAILSFRNDNGLIVKEEIDDEFLLKLQTAKPRSMIPARANATPAQVASVVPEVRTNALSKIGAAIVAIPGALISLVVGSLEYLGVAKSYLEPLQEAAGDVPGSVWVGLITIVAGGLYFWSRHGEQKGIEAFRDGDRR